MSLQVFIIEHKACCQCVRALPCACVLCALRVPICVIVHVCLHLVKYFQEHACAHDLNNFFVYFTAWILIPTVRLG